MSGARPEGGVALVQALSQNCVCAQGDYGWVVWRSQVCPEVQLAETSGDGREVTKVTRTAMRNISGTRRTAKGINAAARKKLVWRSSSLGAKAPKSGTRGALAVSCQR